MREGECFRCHKKFPAKTIDDVEGDGRCPDCEQLAKTIAKKVDRDMIKRRKLPKNPRAELIKELIHKGGHINARDLGITPHG